MSINTFIPAVNIANYCALQVLQRILHQTNFVERHFDFPVNFVTQIFHLFLAYDLDLTTSIAYRDPQSNKEHETSYITEIIAAVDRYDAFLNHIMSGIHNYSVNQTY